MPRKKNLSLTRTVPAPLLGKSSGRPLGAKNVIAQETRRCFQQLIDANLPQLQEDILKLSPKDRCMVILRLAEFVLPKLQAIDLRAATESKVSIVANISRLIQADDETQQ